MYKLQQQYVLAELGEHLVNHPVDASSTALVLRYLRVLNALFEEGFLSHEVIRSVDSPTLLKMQSATREMHTSMARLPKKLTFEPGDYV